MRMRMRMSLSPQGSFRRRLVPQYRAGFCHEDRASQIVEFALSVPLLVFFVIGIFDFSGALALKHKLAGAAREAARVAAADPATDLASPSASAPVSISDAVQVVDTYLLSEKLGDCGIASATLPAPSALTWTITSSAGNCPGGAGGPGLTLKVNRGCITKATIDGVQVDLIETCVTLKYPYVWQFNSVAVWFGGFTGPTTITTGATALNEN